MPVTLRISSPSQVLVIISTVMALVVVAMLQMAALYHHTTNLNTKVGLLYGVLLLLTVLFGTAFISTRAALRQGGTAAFYPLGWMLTAFATAVIYTFGF
jgi:uncharacterized membrane protein YGL010W